MADVATTGPTLGHLKPGDASYTNTNGSANGKTSQSNLAPSIAAAGTADTPAKAVAPPDSTAAATADAAAADAAAAAKKRKKEALKPIITSDTG
ncbi:hypothetical protein BROUX41_004385 [Berkeleyomyces rouxiae]|uniref:uncharacterized protein n=1 Tax=Berkeleyomyces rouxiae TaxID=2035830 RepID=UPI003B7F6AEE